MLSRFHLSLDMADKMADGVISAAKAINKPITVVIVDDAANVIVQKRMDSCPPIGAPSFAYGKAFVCVAMKCSSRAFRDKYTTFPEGEIPDPKKYCQMTSMVSLTDGKIAPFPGGILLKEKTTGQIIGSIGVSGASSDEDEQFALSGARLFADFISADTL